jgi:glycosyltransferase involved in cell wall biosynthesis
VRVVQVLWTGGIGGAERFTARLAQQFRRTGIDAQVLFIAHAAPLARDLERYGVPYDSLGLARGSDVVRCPRSFARLATRLGKDVALLDHVGYEGVALRLGGYRGAVIGVEHGALNVRHPPYKRLLWFLDRVAAVPFYDAEVAVSRFQASIVRRTVHPRPLLLIPHGIQVPSFNGSAIGKGDARWRIGHLSRLVPGKGADRAIRALGELHNRRPSLDAVLEIGGDGEQRPYLAALVKELGLADRVAFRGFVEDPVAFWENKDVAVALGDDFVESFGISALEAMASGKPLITSHVGALPELVDDGVTGHVVDPTDTDNVAQILLRYLTDDDLRLSHGRAGRRRAAERFSIERCASSYLRLFDRCQATSSAPTSCGRSMTPRGPDRAWRM